MASAMQLVSHVKLFLDTFCTYSDIVTGLLVLPYVFSAELWPNNIRSFGSALTQCFHWLFYFGVNRGTPAMLNSMDNWGTFIFFAGWCFVSLLYAFVAVPETAGLTLEHVDTLFEGPFWQMHQKAKRAKDVEMVVTEK
jgi:hypothetical protein